MVTLLDWAWANRMGCRREAGEMYKLANKYMVESDALMVRGRERWGKGEKNHDQSLTISVENDLSMAVGDRWIAAADFARTQSEQLWAHAARTKAVGDELWTEIVLHVHGNIMLTWEWVEEKSDYRCRLSTGEVFEP